MCNREIWKAKRDLYKAQVEQNINTPIDDFNHLKNILNEKNDSREKITSNLYQSYALADMAMNKYRLKVNEGA